MWIYVSVMKIFRIIFRRKKKREAQTVDWSLLLPELLDVILTKLTESTDHIRFRCVCQSWRSAARSHQLPPSIPWLCLPRIDSTTTNLQFYSLSEDKVYKIYFPRPQKISRIVGSASGFLLIIEDDDNPSVLIMNPFTGTRAQLPYAVHHSSYIAWDYSGSIVVGNYGCMAGASYCHPADNNSWSRIEALANRYIRRVIYKASGFCIMDNKTSEVIILDSQTLDVTRIIQPPNVQYNYFIVSRDDDIQFRSYLLNEMLRLCTVLFTINPQLEESCWLKITDFSDYTFFDNKRDVLVSKDRSCLGLRKSIVFPHIPYEKTSRCYIYASDIDSFGRERIRQCRCFSNAFWIHPRFE